MKIASFILSQSETILHILTCKIGDIKMLEELKLITCLLSKLSPFGLFIFFLIKNLNIFSKNLF